MLGVVPMVNGGGPIAKLLEYFAVDGVWYATFFAVYTVEVCRPMYLPLVVNVYTNLRRL
jgi:hypothetical protein